MGTFYINGVQSDEMGTFYINGVQSILPHIRQDGYGILGMTCPSSHNLPGHDSGLIRNGLNLNQHTDFARGVLSDSNSDGILDTVASPSRTQVWDLDAMGNWQSLSTNGTGQSRTTDAQNQVTGVGSASLTFDANGSMTTDETGQQFVYDAWNRIVKVLSPSSVTKVEYAYLCSEQAKSEEFFRTLSKHSAVFSRRTAA